MSVVPIRDADLLHALYRAYADRDMDTYWALLAEMEKRGLAKPTKSDG